MAKTALITDWIKVATSGRAFDGRTIDPQWLLEMAEDYSQDTYTALLWPEHERWYNLGEVKELKAQTRGDVVELYARLAPNAYYLSQNMQKQGLFFSIEVDLDVAGPGRAYLGGLAVTDSPASLGMAPTHFKASDGKKLFFSSKENAPHPRELGLEATTSQTKEMRTFFESLKGEFSAFFNKFTQKHEENPAMEKWEEAIAQLREEINGRLDALEERLKALEEANGGGEGSGGDMNADGDADDKKEHDKAEGEKDEEYKRLFASLSKKLDDMNAKFSQGQPGTPSPENTGGADLKPLI